MSNYQERCVNFGCKMAEYCKVLASAKSEAPTLTNAQDMINELARCPDPATHNDPDVKANVKAAKALLEKNTMSENKDTLPPQDHGPSRLVTDDQTGEEYYVGQRPRRLMGGAIALMAVGFGTVASICVGVETISRGIETGNYFTLSLETLGVLAQVVGSAGFFREMIAEHPNLSLEQTMGAVALLGFFTQMGAVAITVLSATH